MKKTLAWVAACREAYPTGPISALLEQMGK